MLSETPGALVHQLRGERDRFVAFAFANADILLEVDKDGTLLFADGATQGLIGEAADTLVGRNFVDMVHEEDRNHASDMLAASGNWHRFDQIKIRLKGERERTYPFALSGYKLPDMKNHLYLTLSLIRAEVSVEEIGKRDLNTGLLRQRHFEAVVTERLMTKQDDEVSITMVDFPELHEMLMGDERDKAVTLMQDICRHLKQHSLDGDMAACLDGGVYGLLHDDAYKQHRLMSDMQRIANDYGFDEHGLDMRVKSFALEALGLSELDTARALHYTINRFAEDAGDEFTIHSLAESYEMMLDETVHKIGAFRRTLGDDLFDVALQPIVDMKAGTPHHFEVLTRLREDDEFQNPFQFITFGEQAGLIGDFDLAMTQKVIDTLNDALLIHKRPVVAVNLSGLSLSSDLFKDAFLRLLKSNPKISKQMIVEVTESARIDDLSKANRFLQELRHHGNLCCLDDFGVGESSFDYLRHLEVDFVKIDGSYVRDSQATTRGRHLLKAMVSLCHDLQMVTIGEMVEDKAVAEFLRDSGVEFGQGYYFGKPTTDIDRVIEQMQPMQIPSESIQQRRKQVSTASSWYQAYSNQVS